MIVCIAVVTRIVLLLFCDCSFDPSSLRVKSLVPLECCIFFGAISIVDIESESGLVYQWVQTIEHNSVVLKSPR